MFRYAVKRIIRGKGMFLSLFLSVALATTLFAGILQGADAIGARSLDQIFDSAPYDIIDEASHKNITKTRILDVENVLGHIEGVTSISKFIWAPVRMYEPGVNATVEGVYLIAIPDGSKFYDGLKGVEQLERGKIYFDVSSALTEEYLANGSVTLNINTYLWKSPPGFEDRQFTLPIADAVAVEDTTWTLFVGRYDRYLQGLFSKNDPSQRRPSYNLILMSTDTYMDIQHEIFAEDRRPTDDQNGVALISLDRENLVNPWDITSSKEEVDKIFEEINANGAEYMYLPRNFLGEMLDAITQNSNQMKTSTIVVSLPVFFTAWYLGTTIAEVVFGLRRREIGLLLTRGLNPRQVLKMLLFEGFIVSILASVVGIIGSSLVLPLVIQGVNPVDILLTINPVTLVFIFIFSTALALFSIIRPAQEAVDIDIVEALREHITQEEEDFELLPPLIALLLGTYRFVMIYFGVTVDQFRPTTSNLIVQLIYSTWWGSDYLLSFIAPILFFWGFTKLFVYYVPWYRVLSKISELFAGDVASYSTLSSTRNLKRTAATTFMVALIVGYSVTVIGNVATSEDFIESAVYTSVGADTAVWLFEGEDALSVLEKVRKVEGVESASLEILFTPDTSLGAMPVRGIDPLTWRESAYMPEDFVDDLSVFEAMNNTDNSALIERGAAEALGLSVNNTMLIQTAARTYQVRIVGFFGKEAGENWVPSNPMMYVNDIFMERIKERYIDQRRIIAKLEPGVNNTEIRIALGEVDPDVQRVDLAGVNLENALNNVLLSGPKQIQVLGTYFAGLVASVGIILIISTMIRSRIKELTIMAIRGFSPRQMAATLLTENLGMDLFAISLGLFVGVFTLYGIVNLFNNTLAFIFSYKVVFPTKVIIQIGAIIGLIIVSTIIPIVVAVNRISTEPDLKLEE
ncbi:FtsX-like permease family protein [Candidatus Bathyarchaeota archaeon]|nr:FtsX-like permease family protein [Candidatus Bathyarchaeota archaeon]